MSLSRNAALILIDIQNAWNDPRWGRRNNPDAERNIARLLYAWRETKRPLFYIQHISKNPDSPFQPDTPAIEIKSVVCPRDGEPVLQKHAHSAFIGTDLEERLRSAGITTLVLTGFMTNHCVETTARMAGDLGFTTYVVSDGTATYDREGPDGVLRTAEEIHAMTFTNLFRDFALDMTTDEVLSALA